MIIGVMFNDLFLQLFLVRDYSNAGFKQNLLHHFLTITGSSVGIWLGGSIGTVSNITAFTEITTPFVNNRYFLSLHNKSDGKCYLYNGLMMTFSFFIFRCVFMSYLVVGLTIGSLRDNNYHLGAPELQRYAIYVSICLYFILLALNFVWFHKMVKGAIKHLNKQKAHAE